MSRPRQLTVGLGGFGAIGGALARRLDRGLPGLQLVAVSARDVARAERRIAELQHPVPVVTLAELARLADVVVECAPAAVFRQVAEPALRAGRIFMPLSVGQLLEHPDLIDLAERTGARIIVPTGALLGLDAVRAAAEGEIRSVTMVTRKPPRGLAGAPYLEQHGIDVLGLSAPPMAPKPPSPTVSCLGLLTLAPPQDARRQPGFGEDGALGLG